MCPGVWSRGGKRQRVCVRCVCVSPTVPGLYGRVHRLGGPRIRKDLASRFEELSPGEVAVTSGFNLPAYNVIHAVVLHADDVESTVDACVRRALNSAKDRGFRTVAFPALGATEAGTTMVKCVDTLVRGVRTFLEEGETWAAVCCHAVVCSSLTPCPCTLVSPTLRCQP